MEDLKVIYASNLIALRGSAGLTQAELAQQLNYTDKAVSKWERAESMPDASVIKATAQILGVTVDYMLSPHDQWDAKQGRMDFNINTNILIGVVMVSIFTLAVLVFVILMLTGSIVWQIFPCTITVMLITLLVLNSLLKNGKHNAWIVATLILSVFATIYCFLLQQHPWQLVFVLVLAELLSVLCFNIKKVKFKR